MDVLVWVGVGIAVVVWLFGGHDEGGSGGHRHAANRRCRCRLF